LKGLSGKTVAIDLPADSSVAELHDAVEQHEGVPTSAQELTCQGRVVNEQWKPRGVDTLNGSSVHLGVRLLGAGRGRNMNKGRRRQFTAGPEEEEDERKAKGRAAWKAKHGGSSDEDEDEDEEDGEGGGATKGEKKEKKKKKKKEVVLDEYGIPIENSSDEDSDDDEEEEDEDEDAKAKGVESLIDIQNPNRENKDRAVGDLTRRQREEIEQQEAKAKYEKLHKAGKTDEAKADMARLAIIRKEREEKAKKKAALAAAQAAAGGRR